MTRRNLVIVRAGRGSLHPRWLENADGRNWDLIVSYYDPQAWHEHPEDVHTSLREGGKWDGLHALLADGRLLERYDYVWLPDDDIDATSDAIDTIFEQMRTHGLSIAQPALTHESYHSHFLMFRCRGFVLRYTNFVEIMVPCFKTDLLRDVVPEFEGSLSGFGLDRIWCRFERAGKAAVLDSVAVHHTRPIGGALRRVMENKGLSPEQEEGRLMEKYGLKGRHYILAYGGVLESGRTVHGKRRMGLPMAWRYLRDVSGFRNPRHTLWDIWHLLRRQISRPINLTTLPAGGVRQADPVGGRHV